MADKTQEMDSVGDSTDDRQLTIRIPNPKTYIARQSLWIGRRGKLRCDGCRASNLKCDRVLPTCNYCAWAPGGKECKYTPLPTPAHRGIPRCDLCRLKNLKCDRNLPICNNCEGEKETRCNYTPKKRQKAVANVAGSARQGGTSAVADVSEASASAPLPSHRQKASRGLDSGDEASDASPSTYGAQGHQSAAGPSRSEPRGPSGRQIPAKSKSHRGSPLTSSRRTYSPSHGAVVGSLTVEPWNNHAFAPLPDAVLRRLALTNLVEMPDKAIFEELLDDFLSNLIPELRETACPSPEVYAAVVQALSGNKSTTVSDSVQFWMSCHPLRLGSRKTNLLIIPRDSIFLHSENREGEGLLKGFQTFVDGDADKGGKGVSNDNPSVVADTEPDLSECIASFERIPVRNQVYDILTYAHREHVSSSVMLDETRKIAITGITWPMAEMFVRLCPLCNLRNKPAKAHETIEPTQMEGVAGGD